MTDQLALVDVPAKPALTPRQQRALEHIQARGSDGIHADELGALMHAEKGGHTPDDRCRFCASTGNELLRRLRKDGLVKQRRGTPDRPGYWHATSLGPGSASWRARRAPGAFGEFPEGF